jgi:hypothetical protein
MSSGGGEVQEEIDVTAVRVNATGQTRSHCLVEEVREIGRLTNVVLYPAFRKRPEIYCRTESVHQHTLQLKGLSLLYLLCDRAILCNSNLATSDTRPAHA